MKHLFLILVLLVVGYVGWQFTNPIERRHASRFLTRHALRLGAGVLLVLLLVAAAVYLPSSGIFF